MGRETMSGLVRAGRRFASVFAWLCLLGLAPLAHGQATPQYTSFCFGCHSATPSGPRLNAGNASAVITAANTNHGMGLSAAALAQIGTIATEIGQFLSGTTTASVNYQSSGNAIPINDLFIDNPSAVITSTQTVAAPTRGTINHIAGSVSPTYNHTATNCTTDNFSVRGIGSANTATRQVSITINPPAAPTAGNATFNIAYSTGATGLDVNPFVSGTTPIGTINVGGPSPNVGSIAATGAMTFNYTASASAYAPTVTTSYTVAGPCSTTSASRTITINVGAPPAPVGANVGPLQRPSATPSNIDLTPFITGILDTTPAAPAGTYILSVTQPSAPGSGSTSVNAGTNTVVYTPSGTFTGVTTFTYQRSGPGGTSVARTVTLDVTSAPVGTDSTAGPTAFNTPINVDVGPLIAGTFTTVASGPAAINGTSSVVGTTVTYTPTPGFFGSGGFTYTATGPGGTSTPNTITIQVLPPAPTANNGAAVATYQTATPIDVAPFITGVLNPGTPVNAFTPVNGTITNVTGTVVTFLPSPGFTGAASFQYNATGPGGTSGNATVNVTVNPPPAPTAAGGSFLVSATNPTTIDLSTLITGFTNSIQITTTPLFGTLTVNGLMVIYTPAQANGVTSVTFAYRAVGPGGNSAPATVTLDYTNAPVTPNRQFNIPFNTITTLDLMERTAGLVSTINILTQPANGIVLVRGGVITYQPNTGFFGPDSFTYSATGPGGTSQPGTVSLTVNPPVGQATNATVSVPFNTPTTINFANFVTGVATGIAIVTQPQHGTIVINGTTGVYTPTPGYFGPDTLQYAAVNGAGTSEPATLTINVGSVKPIAGAATMTVQLNSSGSLNLAPFISGSGVQGVSIPKQAAHGTVTVNGTVVTYTPKHDFFGNDSFQYVAFGNLGASDKAGTVTVTVVGRPDPSLNPDLKGLVEAQTSTTGRFARTQIGNMQRRMETLHRGPDSAFPEAPPKAPKPAEGEGKSPSAANPPATTSLGPQQPAFNVPNPRGTPNNPQAPGASLAGASDNPLVSSLISLAASQSVSLNGASTLRDGTSVWVGGIAQFGDIEGNGERSGTRFSTDGLTFGADRRLSDRLAVGIAAGYARDETRIGADGSKSKARGTSFGVYSSYQPTPSTFVDALAGIGKIDFDSTRWVEPFEAYATAGRKADQFFASVAAGYEWRRDGVLVSPYGRLDLSRDKLKGVTESGADQYNLRYADQTLRSTQLGIGLRAEAQHEMDFGRVVPRARVEYRREFQDDRSARVSYADLLGGPEYNVTASGLSRNSLLLGVGTEFLLSRGLKIGVDYQAERGSGGKNVQGYRLFVSQDLDFKGPSPFRFGTDPLFEDRPISIDFGFTHDTNVGRGRLAEEKRQDNVTSVGVGQEWIQPLGTNLRLVATPLITAEKFRRFAGLGRFSGGIQGELQYRGSAAFDATTFALRGSAVWDQYESRLRTGGRYFLGVNARRALTDRIDLFGELGGNARNGRSEVFELRDVAAKANLDYSLGRNGTVYVSGEFRRGDTFSSGFGSLTNLALADVFVADDAFEDGVFAYRIEARTVLGTLGYNRPLGPRDSIDFSWRRVQSTPTNKPGFETGSLRYNDNQYSIVYLLRF